MVLLCNCKSFTLNLVGVKKGDQIRKYSWKDEVSNAWQESTETRCHAMIERLAWMWLFFRCGSIHGLLLVPALSETIIWLTSGWCRWLDDAVREDVSTYVCHSDVSDVAQRPDVLQVFPRLLKQQSQHLLSHRRYYPKKSLYLLHDPTISREIIIEVLRRPKLFIPPRKQIQIEIYHCYSSSNRERLAR